MTIKHRHLPVLSAKIIPAFMLSLSILVACSCKKAPPTGEAFVTLKSDEIRFLGDLEVSFYRSDFNKKLEDFQSSFLSEAKTRAANPYEKKVAKISNEIKAQETLIENVDEEATKIAENETSAAKNALIQKLSDRESELQSDLTTAERNLDAFVKRLADEKQTLISKQSSLKGYLADAKPKHASLMGILEPHLNEEKELINKAHDLGNAFYADISELTTKINNTIVAEKIPTKQLIDPAVECKNHMMSVKARSASEVLTYKYNYAPDAPTYSVNYDSFWSIYEGDLVVFFIDDDDDGFKLGWRKYAFSRKNVFAKNIPKLLEKSFVAKEIIAAEGNQSSFCSKIVQINLDTRANDKSLRDSFRIWMNENDMDSERAKSLLLKYEANLREFEAIPEQIKAVEQKQTEAPKEAASRKNNIETTAETDIKKIKEEIASFEQNIADYKKNRHEIAKKYMLTKATSKLNELKADLKEANTTIEKIKSATSISELCAVDGVGRDVIDADAPIGKIKKFLNEAKLSSTRTGSDGKFKVPGKARYAMAYHYRAATKNELFWLIKINLDEEQVRLTNSNITNTHQREDSDDIWDILRSRSGKSLLEVLDVSFGNDA